jgi:hypothetical protein
MHFVFPPVHPSFTLTVEMPMCDGSTKLIVPSRVHGPRPEDGRVRQQRLDLLQEDLVERDGALEVGLEL